MCKLALLALMLLQEHSDDDVIQEYDHRRAIVGAETSKHRDHVRQRMLALYKMQRGGYARLLFESQSRGDFFVRRAAAARIVERDLAELRLYARERATLDEERKRLEMKTARFEPEVPLTFRPPVASANVLAHYGAYHDPTTGLELTRRGVLLAAHSNEIVRAPAAGIVRFAGPLEEQGQTVVIEHDGGLYTVVAHLKELRVLEDNRVAGGDEVGTAGGPILFQLRRGTTPLDPEPLLRHTGKQ
jgi:murein DD-endopeptidase MepM/ murein hydrolase activator NlpD